MLTSLKTIVGIPSGYGFRTRWFCLSASSCSWTPRPLVMQRSTADHGMSNLAAHFYYYIYVNTFLRGFVSGFQQMYIRFCPCGLRWYSFGTPRIPFSCPLDHAASTTNTIESYFRDTRTGRAGTRILLRCHSSCVFFCCLNKSKKRSKKSHIYNLKITYDGLSKRHEKYIDVILERFVRWVQLITYKTNAIRTKSLIIQSDRQLKTKTLTVIEYLKSESVSVCV